MPPRANFFYSQRLRLHYAEWGDSNRRPLLLIHGGRDHCRNWDWVAERLCADWRVIAPDLRGHGDSQWCQAGNYTYDAYVWDLLALVDHLDIERATIIGHSLGGNVALRFAAAFPERVRRFVCIEGLGTSPSGVERTHATPYSQRLRDDALYRQRLLSRPYQGFTTLEQALEHYHKRNPSLSTAQAKHLAYHGLRRQDDGSYVWKFDDLSRKPSQACASEREIRQLIEAVECPVLLPWGGRSFFSLDENMARIAAFTNASVRLYPSAGHWPHHTELETFVEDVRGFLK